MKKGDIGRCVLLLLAMALVAGPAHAVVPKGGGGSTGPGGDDPDEPCTNAEGCDDKDNGGVGTNDWGSFGLCRYGGNHGGGGIQVPIAPLEDFGSCLEDDLEQQAAPGWTVIREPGTARISFAPPVLQFATDIDSVCVSSFDPALLGARVWIERNGRVAMVRRFDQPTSNAGHYIRFEISDSKGTSDPDDDEIRRLEVKIDDADKDRNGWVSTRELWSHVETTLAAHYSIATRTNPIGADYWVISDPIGIHDFKYYTSDAKLRWIHVSLEKDALQVSPDCGSP